MLNLLQHILNKARRQDVFSLTACIVLGLSIFFITKSLVYNALMPLLGSFAPNGHWEAINLKIWNIEIDFGYLLADGLIFLILLWLISGLFVFQAQEEDKKHPKDDVLDNNSM